MCWNESMWRWAAGLMCGAVLVCGCRTTDTTGYESTSVDPMVEQPAASEPEAEREPAPMVGEDAPQDGERRGEKIDLGLGSGSEDGGEVHIESSETLLEKREQAEDLEAERTRCEALLKESCAGDDLACLEKLDASCAATLNGEDAASSN